MPYFVGRELRLFYKDVGQGATLVLIPGLGGDSRVFNPGLPFLRGRARLLMPDPRALGRSEGKPAQVSMEAMVRDLVELLGAVGLERASFLGASLGAVVAGELAATYPHLVEKLILCTPPASEGSSAGRVGQLLGQILWRSEPQEIMVSLLELTVSPGYLERNRRMIRELARQHALDEGAILVLRRQLEVLQAHRGDWGRIRVPTLILGGDQDRLVSLDDLEIVSNRIGGSEVSVLKGIGHHVFLEAPNLVAREVLKFLGSWSEK